jgi:phage FluMu gp28-like protein
VVERYVSSFDVKNVRFIPQSLWTLVLLPVLVMVSMWWVAMPGGRAGSAQMLRTPMVVQTVPLSRGWYQVAVDFREGNPELYEDSNVFL